MKTTPHPKSIKKPQLPPNVWWHTGGNGRWMIQAKTDTGKWRSHKLCTASATITQIWQAYDATKTQQETTFKSISLAFQQSAKWKELSRLTQSDYIYCHQKITSTKTKTGQLGDHKASSWTPGTLSKYRDMRGQESPSRANKELAYIKRVWAWAYEYEIVPNNPTTGISRLKQPPRQHYATDKDFYFLLKIAEESGYWYMPGAMMLAYQAKMRLSEVLDLTEASETDEGLYIARRKGSRDTIMLWTDATKKVWDDLKAKKTQILTNKKIPLPIKKELRHIFLSEKTGDKLTINALKTAKGRIDALAKKSAEKSGIKYTHFTFHDIKRKGISDSDGNQADKMAASGHKSASMMAIYDIEKAKVKPTKG